MAMVIVKKDVGIPKPVTKRMDEMRRGEVCFVMEENYYVVNVGISNDNGSRFLILDTDVDIKWYAHSSGSPRRYKVRELYPNESITIKFS